MKKTKRWVPKAGDTYYFVVIFNNCTPSVSDYCIGKIAERDNFCRFNSNCFRTKREAQAAAKKINKILRGEK